MSDSEFTNSTTKLAAKSINLFAIGMMLVMAYASKLRKVCAMKQGVDSYVELLLKTLKTV